MASLSPDRLWNLDEVATHHNHSTACLHCRAVVNELRAHHEIRGRRGHNKPGEVPSCPVVPSGSL